jgi:uncharacterized protein with HEPN domain
VSEDRLYLVHIRECIERIERYVAGGRSDFLADTRTQDAVLRNLQVLAESSQRLSPAIRARHAGIDWRGMAGFRNLLTHDYLGVDLERVWQIIEIHVPILHRAIDEMIEDVTDRPWL